MKLNAPPTHEVRYEGQLKERPPQKGWRAYEPTGKARATCTCGRLDSGYIDPSEAKQAARQHVADYLPGVPFDLA